jgi:glutaconyl-CoA decarboxylase
VRIFKVNVNGVSYNVEVQEEGAAISAVPAATVIPAAAPVSAVVEAPAAAPAAAAAVKAAPAEVAAGDTPITAPMPGKVSKITAKEGTTVKKGDVIMLLEAMKMQNEIGAPAAGVVKSINIAAGESVKPGQVLAVIKG